MTGVVAIYHNPYNRWIHLICTGEFTAAEFERALLSGMDALKAHYCTDLIVDCALASGAAYASGWTAGEWLRAAQSSGLKRLAFVYSPLISGVPTPALEATAFFPCHNLSSATRWLSQKS